MCMSFTQNTNLVQVLDTFLVTYFDVRAFILPHSAMLTDLFHGLGRCYGCTQ